jgi:hypothetical protein
LFGRKQVGKTTVARILGDYGYQRMGLADPMKDMVATLPGITWMHLYGDQKETPLPHLGGTTPREMLQTLGTEWGQKHVSPDMWVRIWLQKAEALDRKLVCDDGRFVHEWRAFTSDPDTCTVGVWRETGLPIDRHPSESFDFSPDDFDYNIDNNGSIEWLQQFVGDMVQSW